jgi:hypothetical protein
VLCVATLLQVPEELDNIPMVDEALASAAYTTATAGARTPSRKTRWTTEQIEALIEGVEKYGLSAWRTIVMVSWGVGHFGWPQLSTCCHSPVRSSGPALSCALRAVFITERNLQL